MIALVQNTKLTVTVNGKKVLVWEGKSQAGIRFHLFALGAQPMGILSGPEIETFTKELADSKPGPAPETAALPATLEL